MAKSLENWKLIVSINADASRALANLRAVDSQAARSSARLLEVGKSAQSVGTGLSLRLTAPLAAFGVQAVRAATDLDSLKRGLTAVSGSSAEAEKQLARLKEVAKLPGLGFKEAIQGSINLQAAGLSATLAERSLGAFGNALATVGKGKSELDGVILALGQIESKGKVSAEEINQLAERVPQIRKAIVAAFGTADTEVLQKAKITSRQFIEAIVRELEKLPQAAGGAKNTFENLSDAYEQSIAKIGNAGLRTLVPVLERVTPLVEGLGNKFAALSPEAQGTAINIGLVAAALGPANYLIGTAATTVAGLTTALRATSAAAAGAGGLTAALGTLNPITVGLTAVVAAGAAVWWDYKSATAQAAATAEEAARRVIGAQRLISGEKSGWQVLPNGAQVYALPNATGMDTTGLPRLKLTSAQQLTSSPSRGQLLSSTPTTPKLPAGSGGGGRKSGSGRGAEKRAKAEREAREQQEALEKIEATGQAARLERTRTGLSQAEEEVRRAYGQNRISLKQYYNELGALAEQGTTAELMALERRAAALENKKLTGAKDLERRAELIELNAEAERKLSEGLAAIIAHTNDYKEALAQLPEVDWSQQLEVAAKVPAIIEQARAKVEGLHQIISGEGLKQAEYERDREAIQTRIALGQITEQEGKRELLKLEQAYRAALLEILAAKREMAGLDAEAIAALDAQIERAKRLGTEQETKKRGSLFDGMGANVGANVTDQMTAGQGAMEGLRDSLDEVKEIGKQAFGSLAQGIGQIVGDFILLGETGPGALKKLTAQVLASAASEAAVLAIMETAKGFAAMFTHPAKASAHFTAAAIFASVAVGAGIGGRALAGKKDKGLSADEQRQADIRTKTDDSYGGNNFTRREYGGPVYRGRAYLVGERQAEVFVPSMDGRIAPSVGGYSRAQMNGFRERFKDGSIFERLILRALENLNGQLSRLEGIDGNDQFVRWTANNPRAVGRAAVESINSDALIGTRLGTRIG